MLELPYIYAVTQRGPTLGNSPRKFITTERFEAVSAKLIKELLDRIVLHETLPDNVNLMEALLEVDGGTLPNFTCRFVRNPENGSRCSKCSRLGAKMCSRSIHCRKTQACHQRRVPNCRELDHVRFAALTCCP